MKSLFILISICLLTSTGFALTFKDGVVTLEKISEYDRCQTMDYGGDFCDAALKEWVAKHPTDAFVAGKMTRKSMNGWGAIPFFAQAFKAGKPDCADEDVKFAVVSALELADGQSIVVNEARTIAFDKCFAQLKAELVENIKSGNEYFMKNACAGLLKKNALTGLKQKQCERNK